MRSSKTIQLAFLSFTISYHRYSEKQADGCNLCRSTVFLNDPNAVDEKTLKIKTGIHTVFREANGTTKHWTDLILAPRDAETYFSFPQENNKSKSLLPNGIMCKEFYTFLKVIFLLEPLNMQSKI